MVKIVPQADAKSASMGWFFDPGFIQNVQRVAADVEDPSMESIDSVLFALREMGYIRTAETCEHGFSVDECVDGMCELQAEGAALLARHNALAVEHAALLINHNALVEAVAWERECDECGEWLNIKWWDVEEIDLHEIWDIYECARAEVDRLIANEGASDCKGEG